MLRVMILTTDLERGGLPLRMARLAAELPGRGIRPIVGCLAPPGPLSRWLVERSIQTFACGARGAWQVSALARLARVIRREVPDLIHASLLHANVAARLVGRLDRSRPIITASVTIEVERRWHLWAEALSAGLSDLHVANSAAVARHLEEAGGISRAKLRVIPNAIDVAGMERELPLERASIGVRGDERLIVWLGRMDPVKNLPVLVEAVALLQRRMKVRGVLVGDGPERARTASLIAQRGLDSVITMTPWSDAPAKWLKAADLLLFPSRTEGCPNAVLEAMACRCPVVAAAIPACRELIEEGVTGRLAPPGDAVALARIAEEVLCDADRARRMAKTAWQRVCERHAPRQVVDQWVGLYHELLGRHVDQAGPAKGGGIL
jgi:glycosyltransferase involved in cell wall biosynthesis